MMLKIAFGQDSRNVQTTFEHIFDWILTRRRKNQFQDVDQFPPLQIPVKNELFIEIDVGISWE